MRQSPPRWRVFPPSDVLAVAARAENRSWGKWQRNRHFVGLAVAGDFANGWCIIGFTDDDRAILRNHPVADADVFRDLPITHLF